MRPDRQSVRVRQLFVLCVALATIWTSVAADDNVSRVGRVRWSGSTLRGTPDAPAPYATELAFPKLKFVNPVVMAHADGMSRLFVGELLGKVLSFRNDPGSSQADLAIDLKKRHPDLTQFYGMAFPPDFQKTRYVYLFYVLRNNLPDGTVISRFRVRETDPPTFDGDSEEEIIRFFSGGHNGGCLEFGKDGSLYISTGDGTDPSPPDKFMTGQDCSDLLSSILRIDVGRGEDGKRYAIPKDNPFVNRAGVRGEIWAFGLRNPWRMSIDRVTGELWLGDVGWEQWESVVKVERGGNYGWSVMEGPQPVHVGSRVGPSPILRPIKAHPHSEAGSITGGYVYRGRRLPELLGSYVYGDFLTGTVWGIRAQGQTITWQAELARTPLHLVAFGTDADGELYLVDHDRTQQIYRLVPQKPERAAERFPRRLSETGLFASTAEHRVAPGVVPYEINSALWSDGLRAERFLAIPGDGRIGNEDSNQWRFPEGTVLVRTVLADVGEGRSRRVETQVLHLEGEAWRAYSYVWDEDQRDAQLAAKEGETKTLVMERFRLSGPASLPNSQKSGKGERVERAYHVSARLECIVCHNPWVEKKGMSFGVQSASPLGMNSWQVNRVLGSGKARVEQLDRFYETGLLSKRPDPRALARQVDPYDASADLKDRARSYLQTNCAHCHQDGAGGTANIALGIGLTLKATKTVGVKPIQGAFDIDDAQIVAPGDPTRSVLYYRMAKMGAGRMPRAGSNEVDERGVRIIHDWIAAMQTAAKSEAMSAERDVLESGSQAGGAVAKEQTAAIERLITTTRGALLLVGLMDRDRVPEAVKREIVGVGRKSPRVEVRDLFERFLPESERVARLGESIDRKLLLSVRGDPGRGKLIFEQNKGAQCGSCHRVGTVGGSVGPDLSKIGGKYPRDAILDQILEPSKTIDPAYVAQLLELKDGRVLNGLVVENGPKAIGIKDAQGAVHLIARGDIERIVAQGRSLMPEQLLKDLTVQQAADLLEFLVGSR